MNNQNKIRNLNGAFCLLAENDAGTIYSFDEVKAMIADAEKSLECEISFEKFCQTHNLHAFYKIYKPSELANEIGCEYLPDNISFEDFEKLMNEEYNLWLYNPIPGNDWNAIFENDTDLIAVDVDNHVYLLETGD